MAEYQFDNDMYMDNINIQMQDLSGRNTSVSSDSDDKKKVQKKSNNSYKQQQNGIDPTLIRQEPELRSDAGLGQQQLNLAPSEKSWYAKICPCLSIDFFQVYFDVSTADIIGRLIASLIPFNRKFYTMYKSKPDLYGPMWIYTTLIIVLTVAGNYSLYLQSDKTQKFVYKFNFIPIAATVIYSAGLGLPFALKLLMKFMGANFFSGSFIEILGIYAYSFTSFLFTAFVCAFPISGLQWGFLIYSAVTSTGFLMVTYWNDLQESLDAKKRFIVIAFICGVQCMFLLIFKLYFFQHVSGQ
ncbi:yip1 domain containing protein [Stylonychia lemnae]|uniref:Protein YIPF n=1 Tax=Stylonychia lemnae TaxID=5949 RepID=A0A078A1U2_STYLE|nr:yip1 domain containing protein [Stylonychia lemnae]|eukprot:CDW76090.1 yip1 domain containing protein [Stylonychia lemnae]